MWRQRAGAVAVIAMAVVVASVWAYRATAGDADQLGRDAAGGASQPQSSPPQSTPTPVVPAPKPYAPPPIPGFLLVADRGNNRILLLDGHKRVLWRYPRPGVRPSFPFYYDDDAFFGLDYHAIITNQEDQQTVEMLSFPGGRVLWHYGHVNQPGSALGYLHTPDDAYLLPNGVRTVADIANCRVLYLSASHRVIRQIGTTGVCAHDPPRLLGSPNGDTPLPNGGILVTEITGSWVDAISRTGKLVWSFKAPVPYPSDAQLLPNGHILLADYSSPGHVMILTKTGHVLWEYGPPSGPAALNHPSLALMLPNQMIAVNDDYRHRIVLISVAKHRIIWQYGHTDQPGTKHSYLNTPDGMDFLPLNAALTDPAIRHLIAHSLTHL
jgi:hypothetical protein